MGLPKSTLLDPFIDKSELFLEIHNLPKNENLVRLCAALILNISLDSESRLKKIKRQTKGQRKGDKEFLESLEHMKENYWVELRYFGLTNEDIDESILRCKIDNKKTNRAHPNKLINLLLKYFFKDMTSINIKPKKQWDIVYDLFCGYSLNIKDEEDTGADYYERIKAVYKKAKRNNLF